MISDRLKYYRAKLNFDQRRIARYVGITRSRLQLYEAGLEIPTMEEVEKFAKLFEISVDEILKEEVIRIQTVRFVKFKEDCKKICFTLNIIGYVSFLIGLTMIISVIVLSEYAANKGSYLVINSEVQTHSFVSLKDLMNLRNRYFIIASIFVGISPIMLAISLSIAHIRIDLKKGINKLRRIKRKCKRKN